MGTKQDSENRYRKLPVGLRLMAVLMVAYRARRPVLLEGPTGIGKSEIVEQVAREMGIEFIVLDLSLLEPPDLVGLPVIKDGRTTYALPVILPCSGDGILMLEELNRAERYIQQPALQPEGDLGVSRQSGQGVGLLGFIPNSFESYTHLVEGVGKVADLVVPHDRHSCIQHAERDLLSGPGEGP